MAGFFENGPQGSSLWLRTGTLPLEAIAAIGTNPVMCQTNSTSSYSHSAALLHFKHQKA